MQLSKDPNDVQCQRGRIAEFRSQHNHQSPRHKPPFSKQYERGHVALETEKTDQAIRNSTEKIVGSRGNSFFSKGPLPAESLGKIKGHTQCPREMQGLGMFQTSTNEVLPSFDAQCASPIQSGWTDTLPNKLRHVSTAQISRKQCEIDDSLGHHQQSSISNTARKDRSLRLGQRDVAPQADFDLHSEQYTSHLAADNQLSGKAGSERKARQNGKDSITKRSKRSGRKARSSKGGLAKVDLVDKRSNPRSNDVPHPRSREFFPKEFVKLSSRTEVDEHQTEAEDHPCTPRNASTKQQMSGLSLTFGQHTKGSEAKSTPQFEHGAPFKLSPDLSPDLPTFSMKGWAADLSPRQSRIIPRSDSINFEQIQAGIREGKGDSTHLPKKESKDPLVSQPTQSHIVKSIDLNFVSPGGKAAAHCFIPDIDMPESVSEFGSKNFQNDLEESGFDANCNVSDWTHYEQAINSEDHIMKCMSRDCNANILHGQKSVLTECQLDQLFVNRDILQVSGYPHTDADNPLNLSEILLGEGMPAKPVDFPSIQVN